MCTDSQTTHHTTTLPLQNRHLLPSMASAVFSMAAAVWAPSPTPSKWNPASPWWSPRWFLSPFASASSSTKSARTKIRCRSSQSNAVDKYPSQPIDIPVAGKSKKIVVLGGSGFVGTAICKAAVSKDIEVVSLSRSGRPSFSDDWVDRVTWTAGDVFSARWDEILVGATAVVSTIGGFGNDEQMKKINGEANIVSVNAAKDYGVPRFILISVHDYNLPSFLLTSGYFSGKRGAESEVLSKYPNSGVVLRPAFIYGKRKVENFEIPLDLVGQPVEQLLSATESFIKPLNSLPGSDLFLAPPVSVDDLALAVIDAVLDEDVFGIFTIEQIKEAAKKMKD